MPEISDLSLASSTQVQSELKPGAAVGDGVPDETAVEGLGTAPVDGRGAR